jgi:predicted HicB family RNase H-like nuclease
MSEERKTETLNLRVSVEFKKRLAEEAAKERRSITNYIEAVITSVWRRKEKDKG